MKRQALSSELIEERSIPEPMSGCWLWLLACVRGYGVLTVGGQMMYAHRASYTVHHGPIPDGMFVCHRCDNPCCVNPDHLFVGTPNDNMQDKVRKGRQSRGPGHAMSIERQPRGERCGSAKLTESAVRAIRASTGPRRIQAEKYGVSECLVGKVRRREIWTHVP